MKGIKTSKNIGNLNLWSRNGQNSGVDHRTIQHSMSSNSSTKSAFILRNIRHSTYIVSSINDGVDKKNPICVFEVHKGPAAGAWKRSLQEWKERVRVWLCEVLVWGGGGRWGVTDPLTERGAKVSLSMFFEIALSSYNIFYTE